MEKWRSAGKTHRWWFASMARRRVATSKRRRPRLSGKVLRPRAESIFPGYASYRILLTTAPLKRCSNTNNRALAINLATRSNRATRFETKRANKTQDGRRSIDLRSINGQAINRSTNEIYTVSTWSVHLVGRDPCRGRRWSAPVSGIYLLLAGARALLPRLPFIPPLRPAGEFSTLTLLQARHDAILQAVPDQPGSIDILVFDSIWCARCCPLQFSGETHFRPSPLPFQSSIREDRSYVSTRFLRFFYVLVSYLWLN